MSYTFSTSSGFATDVNLGVIRGLIMAQITRRGLVSVTAVGDSIDIVFDGDLNSGELLLLGGIISGLDNAASPQLSLGYIDPATNTLIHMINGQPQKFLGSQVNEIIISKTSQKHFPTVKAAILANNTPNNIFVVYPGTYVEDNPITLPAGTFLKGAGTAQNCIIVAANPNYDIIKLGAGAGTYNLSFFNAYGVDPSTGQKARGIYLDGSQTPDQSNFSAVLQCFFVDCNIGLESDGKNLSTVANIDTLFCDKIVCKARMRNCESAVVVRNGGQMICTSLQVMGTMAIPNISLQYTFNRAIYFSDPFTKLTLITSSIWISNIGLYANNGGALQVMLLMMTNCNTGIQVGPNVPLDPTDNTNMRLMNTAIFGSNLNVLNSENYDMVVESTSSNINFDSDMLDDTKFLNPNNVVLNIKYNSIVFNEYIQTISGNVRFGSLLSPTKATFGQGEYLSTGSIVLSNTDFETGTWINNTLIATNIEGEFEIFPGTGVGNCCYIGGPQFIPGIKIMITTPVVSQTILEDYIWEYWNGNNWIWFNIMQTDSSPAHYTYRNSCMNKADTFDVRFGLTSATPFALKTLFSFSRYWIRIRIINAIASKPLAQYVRIHVNTKAINNDGFTELFGDARVLKTVATGLETSYPSNSVLGTQELFLAQKLSFSRTNGLFVRGNTCRLGYRTILPFDIDISFPLKLEFVFVGDNSMAGNVSWCLRYSYTLPGSKIYHNVIDAPEELPSTNIITMISIVSQQDTDNRMIFKIPVSCIDSNPKNNMANVLWISLERNSSTSNTVDTYLGNVAMVFNKASYISWCTSGNHLLSY